MAHTRSAQRGISFIGLLFVGGILAAGGVVLAQVVPTVIEYQAVLKAAKKAAQDGDTVPLVRASFDRAVQIDNITAIAGRDLEVTKEGDRVVVRFEYQREIHLTGPAYLTLKYKGDSN